MSDFKKPNMNLDELANFSFTPATELLEKDEEEKKEDDEIKKPLKPTDDSDDDGASGTPTTIV